MTRTDVEIEIVICREIVAARRAELAMRRESKRIIIDELPEPECGQVDLGDLSDLDQTDE